jgi:hypothetical protein
MEDKSESILQEEKDHAKKEEATEAVVTVAAAASKEEDSSPEMMMTTKENPYRIPFSLEELTSTRPRRNLPRRFLRAERSWTSVSL